MQMLMFGRLCEASDEAHGDCMKPHGRRRTQSRDYSHQRTLVTVTAHSQATQSSRASEDASGYHDGGNVLKNTHVSPSMMMLMAH